jgi:Zn-dependent peptidase ImmA (M78 family)
MIVGEKIESKVEAILQKFRIRKPPVSVHRIAKGMGLRVVAVPAEDSISGAIIRDSKEAIIAVNTSQHINRQRFTVAHELAHFLFHEGMEEHVDQNFRVAWRNSKSSKAIDWIEIEANRFAAELLMPTKFLMADLDSMERIDRHSVALLASRYRVSPEAMKFRLTNLGLIPPF